jgi:hypothetical protein
MYRREDVGGAASSHRSNWSMTARTHQPPACFEQHQPERLGDLLTCRLRLATPDSILALNPFAAELVVWRPVPCL